jgi:hypothetical protein
MKHITKGIVFFSLMVITVVQGGNSSLTSKNMPLEHEAFVDLGKRRILIEPINIRPKLSSLALAIFK